MGTKEENDPIIIPCDNDDCIASYGSWEESCPECGEKNPSYKKWKRPKTKGEWP